MHPYMYQMTNLDSNLGFSDPIEKDIVENFNHNGYAFSVGQIADRTGEKRRRIRKIIHRLIKRGIVE